VGPVLGLAAAGAGGGQWTITVAGGRPGGLHMGLPRATAPIVHLSAAALERLLAGTEPAADLVARGGALIEATDPAARRLAVEVLAAVGDGVRTGSGAARGVVGATV